MCCCLRKPPPAPAVPLRWRYTDEGGNVTFLDPGSSQMGKKESMEDTAKVLGRFFDGIEYRGYDQKVVEDPGEIQRCTGVQRSYR